MENIAETSSSVLGRNFILSSRSSKSSKVSNIEGLSMEECHRALESRLDPRSVPDDLAIAVGIKIAETNSFLELKVNKLSQTEKLKA